MQEKIKLNLGCGLVYKQGYVNIDKFDNKVADKICDTANLPFKANSVDLIETSQLIEHFDYIHCKYVLSEWFRILKSGGTLIVETPDLEKAYKKFISSSLETQKTTLQWIYGIDTPGMQHKTGFTFKLLKNLLEEVGFEKVSKKKQQTHTYEPGMRVVCRKPKNYEEKQLFACFRKKLKNKLNIDDSYTLIPLEKWLGKFNLKGSLDTMIIKTAYCNPKIPLAFIEECIKLGTIKKSEAKEKIEFLNFLIKKGFHKKVCTLWIKSRKDKDNLSKEFNDFSERIKSLVSDLLKDKTGYEERLKYIMSLKPENIEIFDLHLLPKIKKKI